MEATSSGFNLEDIIDDVPSIGEQLNLSEKQREIFLEKGFINVPDDKYEDELKVSLSMKSDGSISGMWYTGEEFTIRKEDLFPELKNEEIVSDKIQANKGAKEFVIANLDISSEQRKSFSDYEEYGQSDEHHLLLFSNCKKYPMFSTGIHFPTMKSTL